jgi:glycerate dehydrogenase
MKIVVLDGYTLNPGDLSWDGVAALGDLTVHDRTPPDQVVSRGEGAEILLTNKTPITADDLARLPALRFISVLATGYNIVDVDAAAGRGIPVSNVPEYGTDSVAEFTLALMLELFRGPGPHDAAVKKGGWSASPDWCFWVGPQRLLSGKTLGIVGFGRIGGRLGRLAAALGMNVIAYNPRSRPDPGFSPFAWKSLPDVFETADVVSLHCPRTPDNKGFVDAGLLSRMKPTAVLVNTARGGLITEADLAEALNRGKIAGAGLDVLSVEPPEPENPLMTAENCIITPHIAWSAKEARIRLMDATVKNVSAFLEGAPIHGVNHPEAV